MSPSFTIVWHEAFGNAVAELIEKPRIRANSALNYHVNKGHIQKLPCEYADCDSQKVKAHHISYDEPLDVVWLCAKHETELRILNRQEHIKYMQEHYVWYT